VDVEATTAARQAEVGAARTMINRVQERHGLWPQRLAADTAYGAAEMLEWLVHEKGIEPHIRVFDRSKREDGTFSRSDFTYDHANDAYSCLAGKLLKRRRRAFKTPRSNAPSDDTIRYRASKVDRDICSLKPQCSPKTPFRKVRSRRSRSSERARLADCWPSVLRKLTPKNCRPHLKALMSASQPQ
jgi:hypothetical protein